MSQILLKRGLICFFYTTVFFSVIVAFASQTKGQTHETRAQKMAAIRAAGLIHVVDRTPRGNGRVCVPNGPPCPNGLRCTKINVTYRDGSPPFTTYRCENQFCPKTFIGLMIDGNPNIPSVELIASLRDADDGQIDAVMQCPHVNLWDPQSPNYRRR